MARKTHRQAGSLFWVTFEKAVREAVREAVKELVGEAIEMKANVNGNVKARFSVLGLGFLMGVLIIFLTAGEARAILIESAGFNPETNKIEVKVVYDGGFKDHSFELQWDTCSRAHSETNSGSSFNQVAARLVDVTGWDDTGTDIFHEKLEFELMDPTCRPAKVTVISGLHSRVTFLVPK